MTQFARSVSFRILSFVPYPLRWGWRYWRLAQFLNHAQWWGRDQIGRWQTRRLKEIVSHAYETVPGYRELYDSAGIKAIDVQSLNDLRYVPVVTKELVRDNLPEFTSRAIPKTRRRYVTTGGSTGIPFGFYHTVHNRYAERAFMHAGWRRFGWSPRGRSVVLRGEFIGSPERFWQIVPHRRELVMSSYYLTEERLGHYVTRIRQFGASYLRAYPSSAVIFADLLRDFGTSLDFDIILLGSENVYPWQIERLTSTFPSATVVWWYGHAEQAVLGIGCKRSTDYHLWPFYGHAEILDERGCEAPIGASGEIVGTSFWNLATPFIRYKTMDMAVKGPAGCDQCGRAFPLLRRIEGRLQELVVTGTGRRISMTAVNMHTDVFDNVKQFQFFQETAGKLTLRVVPKETFRDHDRIRIADAVVAKLGSDMELDIVLVDQVCRTRAGKWRFLEQRLEVPGND